MTLKEYRPNLNVDKEQWIFELAFEIGEYYYEGKTSEALLQTANTICDNQLSFNFQIEDIGFELAKKNYIENYLQRYEADYLKAQRDWSNDLVMRQSMKRLFDFGKQPTEFIDSEDYFNRFELYYQNSKKADLSQIELKLKCFKEIEKRVFTQIFSAVTPPVLPIVTPASTNKAIGLESANKARTKGKIEKETFVRNEYQRIFAEGIIRNIENELLRLCNEYEDFFRPNTKDASKLRTIKEILNPIKN
jgi:hypothetical protein